MKLDDAQKKKFYEDIMYINEDCYEDAQRCSRVQLREMIEQNDVFALFGTFSDKVYAFAIVSKRGDFPYIWSIAVKPGFQRKGYGKELLQEIAEHYRSLGRQRILLTVKADNPAQKLYFDCGYRVYRVSKKWYGLDDGLEMRKTL